MLSIEVWKEPIVSKYHDHAAISFASPVKSQTQAASVTTLFSFQAAMDKITEEVHQTILETNQLTRWWEGIVTQMKQQDADSQTCAAVNKSSISI